MKHTIKQVFSILTLLTITTGLFAESFVWIGFEPSDSTSWDISAAYQVSDEIWIIEISGVVTPSIYVSSNPIDLGTPALFVTKVVSQYEEAALMASAVQLYNITDGKLVDFDTTKGDYWINHTNLGWCYTYYYPWVWMDGTQEWSYFWNAGLSAFELPDNTWWIWDATAGWIWTSQNIYPWVWSYTQDAWIER